MTAARICVDCLFANVRRQRLLCTPIASSSKIRITKTERRVYSTQASSNNLEETSGRTHEQANAPGVNFDNPKQSEPPVSEPSISSKTNVESTKTLALARWSALRQSALSVLERQQRELRQRLGEASARINDISGYKEIEALKAEVTRKELELLEARAAAREAKEAYSAALNDRMVSSREVNDLLQRKNNWLESDVSRFTELVRQDHLNEHRERDSKIEVTREEESVERKIGEMMQAILKRYHEEQVWSDKIRSLSTYGTLAITCVNVLIFLLALTLVEPWKRRRMVSEVEGRLRDRDEQQIAWLGDQLEEIKHLLQAEIPQIAPPHPSGSSTETMREPQSQSESGLNPWAIPTPPSTATEDHAALTAPTGPVFSGLSLSREASASQHNDGVTRDVYYSGAAGALLGAAVVTCWKALFR